VEAGALRISVKEEEVEEEEEDDADDETLGQPLDMLWFAPGPRAALERMKIEDSTSGEETAGGGVGEEQGGIGGTGADGMEGKGPEEVGGLLGGAGGGAGAAIDTARLVSSVAVKREVGAPVAVKREAGPAVDEAPAGQPPPKKFKVEVRMEEADPGSDDGDVQEPTPLVGRCKLNPVDERVERD
jgi:hypothetical protein